MINYKLILSYDGTDYFGFKKTRYGRSIEQELEIALNKLLGKKLPLQAAGRTDKNVHARAQVVNFLYPDELHIPNIKYKLNQILPPDIKILDLAEANKNFHPTLDAIAKKYLYQINTANVQRPHFRNYFWNYYYPIDLEKMQAAALSLITKADFSAFSNKKYINPIREIFSIKILKNSNILTIEIIGNNFLYNMVRIIAGTLVQIASHKIAAPIEEILNSKQRKKAGITAFALGLFLEKVYYDQYELLNDMANARPALTLKSLN